MWRLALVWQPCLGASLIISTGCGEFKFLLGGNKASWLNLLAVRSMCKNRLVWVFPKLLKAGEFVVIRSQRDPPVFCTWGRVLKPQVCFETSWVPQWGGRMLLTVKSWPREEWQRGADVAADGWNLPENKLGTPALELAACLLACIRVPKILVKKEYMGESK